jgi:hypothetical protein
MTQRGVKMPSDKNPASKVERYREHAPEIRFLTLLQVSEQLTALADDIQMQAMVARLGTFCGAADVSRLQLIATGCDSNALQVGGRWH